MSDQIRLAGTTVNAPDAIALASFYAEITGGAAKGSTHWAVLDGPNGSLGFQQVSEFRPTAWPEGDPPMQMHLDFFVDDLASTEARVLAAGATRFDFQPNPDHCLVYADPVGHPFCLSTWEAPVLDDDTP
jgi:hypothetical protein